MICLCVPASFSLLCFWYCNDMGFNVNGNTRFLFCKHISLCWHVLKHKGWGGAVAFLCTCICLCHVMSCQYILEALECMELQLGETKKIVSLWHVYVYCRNQTGGLGPVLQLRGGFNSVNAINWAFIGWHWCCDLMKVMWCACVCVW